MTGQGRLPLLVRNKEERGMVGTTRREGRVSMKGKTGNTFGTMN